MKIAASLISLAVGIQAASAFAPVSIQQQSTAKCTSTARPMGLFDFFSEDARREREESRQREIEEQERLQREIIARRSNPEKMEEYQAKVRVRRALRMNGEDEAASKVDMYTGKDEKIVGLN